MYDINSQLLHLATNVSKNLSNTYTKYHVSGWYADSSDLDIDRYGIGLIN